MTDKIKVFAFVSYFDKLEEELQNRIDKWIESIGCSINIKRTDLSSHGNGVIFTVVYTYK